MSRGDSLGDSLIDGLWSLSNLACGSDELTRSILPALPILISMLDSPLTVLQEQAVWCLGNMAAEDQTLRIKLVQSGIVPQLIKLWNQHNKETQQQTQIVIQKMNQTKGSRQPLTKLEKHHAITRNRAKEDDSEVTGVNIGNALRGEKGKIEACEEEEEEEEAEEEAGGLLVI